MSYALKILGIKDYFQEELRRKIETKFGSEEALRVVKELENYGYIDDRRVARSYIAWKLRSGYGPYYISGKLYLRGYPTSIDEILRVASEEDIDMEAYIKSLGERYLKGGEDEPYKEYVRCMSFLKNRGYPLGLCDKLIKKEDFEK